MNIAFIGGGSLRILPIVRSLLENRKILENKRSRLMPWRQAIPNFLPMHWKPIL